MDIFEDAFMTGFNEGMEKLAAGKFEAAKEAIKRIPGKIKEMWRGQKGPGYGREYGTGEMLKELVGKGPGRVTRGKAAKILGTRAAMVGVPTGVGAVGLGAALRKRRKKEKK